ncbi:molecular chaperone [Serratia marcescens]|uniref:fimbrial biogenesis chaperone n=1 Tax=Serratia marcescens TaxID=615 RepID=UPI0024C48F1E|nr:molecular chaperone [Serratia marcescens]MDK1711703.1 molecular chaperone [Serratia marcescens]
MSTMKTTWMYGMLLSLVWGLGGGGAQAAEASGGISLGGTRLIFEGGKEAATLAVTNSSTRDVWLMRFWISPYGETSVDAVPKKTVLPFAVTPPLYRLDPNSAVQLRITKLSEALPADRESVFYLNNLAIPPKKGETSYQKAVQSGLQFAVNTRIKLFYRPAAINDAAAVKAAPTALTVTATGKDLVVKNPTPWFVTLTQFTLNGKALQTDKDTMVAPFGELHLPVTASHGTVSYRTVDDRGMTTPAIDKAF